MLLNTKLTLGREDIPLTRGKVWFSSLTKENVLEVSVFSCTSVTKEVKDHDNVLMRERENTLSWYGKCDREE